LPISQALPARYERRLRRPALGRLKRPAPEEVRL
jgi:hypothetical protein